MRRALAVFNALLLFISINAQISPPASKYTSAALKEDLAFLKEQLFSVHADPFTELNKDKYEQLFSCMEGLIRDSMTAIEFFKLVKPTIANLSDEHSGISLPKALANFDSLPVFLPLTLRKVGKDYQVDSVLVKNTGLTKGMVVTQINKAPVEDLVV